MSTVINKSITIPDGVVQLVRTEDSVFGHKYVHEELELTAYRRCILLLTALTLVHAGRLSLNSVKTSRFPETREQRFSSINGSLEETVDIAIGNLGRPTRLQPGAGSPTPTRVFPLVDVSACYPAFAAALVSPEGYLQVLADVDAQGDTATRLFQWLHEWSYPYSSYWHRNFDACALFRTREIKGLQPFFAAACGRGDRFEVTPNMQIAAKKLLLKSLDASLVPNFPAGWGEEWDTLVRWSGYIGKGFDNPLLPTVYYRV